LLHIAAHFGKSFKGYRHKSRSRAFRLREVKSEDLETEKLKFEISLPDHFIDLEPSNSTVKVEIQSGECGASDLGAVQELEVRSKFNFQESKDLNSLHLEGFPNPKSTTYPPSVSSVWKHSPPQYFVARRSRGGTVCQGGMRRFRCGEFFAFPWAIFRHET
jgi:hypothetical protein